MTNQVFKISLNLAFAGLFLLFSQFVHAQSVSVDNVTSTNSEASSVTFDHTVGSGSDRLLIVQVSMVDVDAAKDVTSVTYGGVSMTEVINEPGKDIRVQIFRLINPSVGTASVNVTFEQKNKAAIGVMSFAGVDQTTPTEGLVSQDGNASSSSITVSSETDDLVVDIIGTDKTISVGSGQTQQWIEPAENGKESGGSTEPGASSVTMSWSLSGGKYTHVGFNINSSADSTPPPAPTNVSATAVASGTIEISFDDVDETGSGVSSYSVKRSTTSGGTYSEIGTVTDDESASYTFTDNSTTDGTTYYYVITAIDGAGNESSNSSEASATADGTAPTISNVTLGESSGNLSFSFDSDEQLGSSAGDLAVSVDGPTSGADVYSFDRTDFSESGTGPYTYTLSTTQPYNDGDGTYTAAVDDALDPAGNDGADGSQTDSYSFDGTAPTISNVSLGISSGNLSFSFDSDEQLGTSATDITVSVDGPTSGADVYSFDRTDFSESGTGPYTYTLSTTQPYDDGDGTYTAAVDDALDQAGNDGADGTQTDSYNYDSSTNTWRSGNTNPTDWETSENWTLGLPTSGQNIVIPTNPENANQFPVIDSNPSVSSVEIQSGATVTIDPT